MKITTSLSAGLLAVTIAVTANLASQPQAIAAQESTKQSIGKQPTKKSKKAKRTPAKPRGGTKYNFGTWERDTTYEGYCDNSYRLGIPTVSCQDFRRR